MNYIPQSMRTAHLRQWQKSLRRFMPVSTDVDRVLDKLTNESVLVGICVDSFDVDGQNINLYLPYDDVTDFAQDEENGFKKAKAAGVDVVYDDNTDVHYFYLREVQAESIAVDLDATLAHYTGWKGPGVIGKPIPRMLSRVKAWIAAGKKVKIFTARAGNPDEVEAIKKWLADNNICDLQITNVKSKDMEEFWDDRAIGVVKNTGERADKIEEAIEQIIEAKGPHIWSFREPDGHEIFRVQAYSRAQAIHLAIKKHSSMPWLEAHIELGRIVPVPVIGKALHLPTAVDAGEKCVNCGLKLIKRKDASGDVRCANCDWLVESSHTEIPGAYFWLLPNGKLVEVGLYGHGSYVRAHPEAFQIIGSIKNKGDSELTDIAVSHGGVELSYMPSADVSGVRGLSSYLRRYADIIYQFFKNRGGKFIIVVEDRGGSIFNARLSMEEFAKKYF